ncbi:MULTISPECIES: polysaccharide deacetylase family protein [Weeksella]|uniref:Polysaccharide deacetylase n=1 Tax=Weeksella virosa (strain ATCC 43766 / DSM 16922 / JCM 21250 / CCUG 30538 / CDC 9751 / IAM 14551 / NBRC 16016 / NCTC 11634 / CL345/78) TaxID=865938 RepID=F0NZ07_WEEVC|nr:MULTISPECIES: polysaccharide deacetylase family protein [Weeksella]ADX68224.1 polysaccharide deacetylase [Weeksella virosa DSM 16922]MDK7374673.1 polysaccharide deacetylase family protein [Weeksella virosa]OFM83236.1 hypothetical protein HMPREF2660_01620 [Weeksella sp. HMSC059D05]SUP54537.1 polysaccharide deacetylase family sporulation protein PdaB [Weeksella virosa]VEH64139.1 polysaccharide deacetylase family sporulation protein PdaB [Weeksella virosa]
MPNKTFFLSFVFILAFSSCKKEQPVNQNYHAVHETTKPSIPLRDSLVIDSIAVAKKQDSIAQQKRIQDSIDDKKFVYLTFDDGPQEGSEKINKIVSEENIKATVFLVGFNAFTPKLKSYVKDYKDNKNIELANHTYTHARNKYSQFYSNADNVLKDIERNNDSILFPNRIVRFPGRNIWRVGKRKHNDFDKASAQVADYIASKQYAIYGWDYEWERPKKGNSIDSPQSIYKGIMHRLEKNYTFEKNHLILLMHDNMFSSVENSEKLRELIRLIKGNDKLVLDVISNYPVQQSSKKLM